MIEPSRIPQIAGDFGAVATHGQTLKTQGKDFADTGLDVHATWQGLFAFYQAPEAPLLFAATVPVKTTAADVGADLAVVGGALIAYADAVRPLQHQLRTLKDGARAFVAKAKAEDDDWKTSQHNVDEHNRLLSETDAAVAAWMAAQRTCANTINALFGGTQYVQDNGDGTPSPNEYGYSAEQLDQALRGDDGLPWGKPEERDKHWYEDVVDDVISFDEGFYVDGIWGDLKGLFALVNFTDMDQLKRSWTGVYELSLLVNPFGPTLVALNQFVDLPGLKKGQLLSDYETMGKGLLDWDEWKKDPARALGNVTWNVGSIVFGTKGTGAALKIGEVAEASEAASAVGRVTAKLPELEIPSIKASSVDVAHIDTTIKPAEVAAHFDNTPAVKSSAPPRLDAAATPHAGTSDGVPHPDPAGTAHSGDAVAPHTATHVDPAYGSGPGDSGTHPGGTAQPPHSGTTPDHSSPGLIRRDDDFSAQENSGGVRKSHLDAGGNLTPANPTGHIEPYQHVLGHRDTAAKSNSPFTSASAEGTDAKIFGEQEIRVDLDRLQHDIHTGAVHDVELLPPDKVQASIQYSIDAKAGQHVDVTIPSDASPSDLKEFVDSLGLSKSKAKSTLPRIQALLNAQRSQEWLIRGVVPHEYIEGPYAATKGKPS